MKISLLRFMILALGCLSFSACTQQKDDRRVVAPKVITTNPQLKSVTITDKYGAQIHAQRSIKVRALNAGVLESISIKDGQAVKQGDVMFKVIPTIDLAKLDADVNVNDKGAKIASLEEAAKARNEARQRLLAAELNFATIKAPFDGVVDVIKHKENSPIEEGEILTTLSDESQLWVYFSVPEAQYLDYMTVLQVTKQELKVELMLENGDQFDQPGKIGAIEAAIHSETGDTPFRADFPNPARSLHHGQMGTIRISRVKNDVLLIPQRATFEIDDKRYVYVVDENHTAHQREIVIEKELDDLFVIKQGLDIDDKIILEGIQQTHDGEVVELEPEK